MSSLFSLFSMGMDHGTLAALREWWGTHYEINWNFRTRTFQARRRDTGELLEDADAGALWTRVRSHQIANDEASQGKGEHDNARRHAGT